MSLARFAKKRDTAEAAIVSALKDIHCKVWKLDRPFDLLVGCRGRFIGLEVKSTSRKRKDQQAQTNEIKACQAAGLPVYRVQTPVDALEAVVGAHFAAKPQKP